jgi:hypothetical protein
VRKRGFGKTEIEGGAWLLDANLKVKMLKKGRGKRFYT